ncbi:MAG: hypothetical protein JSU72_14105 [Deltaproteobacteria bacterium]|nr:MAG: hypothetical protein JSU72_14105 [Deltaproteobacteria bacterium]
MRAKLLQTIVVICLSLVLLASGSAANSGDYNPLSRQAARTLLLSLYGTQYTDLIVTSVVYECGLEGVCGSNTACVFGLTKSSRGVEQIQRTLFYDTEFGWYTYEYVEARDKVIFHTVAGKKEFQF